MGREDRPEVAFVKGETTEDRFTSVETAFRRMARRLNKTVAVVVPPVIIPAMFAGVSGKVVDLVLPIAGDVKCIAVVVDKLDGEAKTVDIRFDLIVTDAKFVGLNQSMPVGRQVVTPEAWSASVGSRLTVTLGSVATGCLSILFQPVVSEKDYLEVAIDALEASYEGVSA